VVPAVSLTGVESCVMASSAIESKRGLEFEEAEEKSNSGSRGALLQRLVGLESSSSTISVPLSASVHAAAVDRPSASSTLTSISATASPNCNPSSAAPASIAARSALAVCGFTITKVGCEMLFLFTSLLRFSFESAGSVEPWRPCLKKEKGDLDRMLTVRPRAGDGDDGTWL
jgi:hypothetical protein